VVLSAPSASAIGPCDPPVNPVVCENSKPGTPSSVWDIVGDGDLTLQGFSTDVSVNAGQSIGFKVNTTALAFRIDIYRIGYYGGDGARLVDTVNATTATVQPACLTDATGLIDCGNWSTSATWSVPGDAVSGVYIAKLIRLDNSGESHIEFVVRHDAGTEALIFQTSDTTRAAYNKYGGNSLYAGNAPVGRARKVSFNRPNDVRRTATEDGFFNAEYPMVRFLEAQGYDVAYQSGVDTDRYGSLLLNHAAFLSVGHDEYWSGGQRTAVEAARAAGVHLAFFSGNEVFWKTRYESSIDASPTAYRTLVSYKETKDDAKTDPNAAWTGTWRDPRFTPPADGGRPENALTGTLFLVNAPRADAIQVPATASALRIWRNTAVAALTAGQTATMPDGTLGYEWDADVDNGSRPAGLFRLSSSTIDVSPNKLQDYGSTYGAGSVTHSLTMYRHASGALVFGAGTVQWSWGLDDGHDRAPTPTDPSMRQATINLLADMGVQPATLQSSLLAANPSTDTTAPQSTITPPGAVETGQLVTLAGTASDVGGVVAGVEVSVDNGATWHPATGTTSWTYSWEPSTAGARVVRTRAVDDSGRLETPAAGLTVVVGAATGAACPCSIFGPSSAPALAADPDTSPIELGVKFKSDVAGYVSGVRFYKGTGNGGTHTGTLWTGTGTALATATFTGESGTGWQTALFPSPVAIEANTTYIASYWAPAGRYASTTGGLVGAVDRGPLHALADGVDGANGIYKPQDPGFPTNTFLSTNYWVDVVFATTSNDVTAPGVLSTTPEPGDLGVSTSAVVRAVFNEAVQAGTVVLGLARGGTPQPGSTSYNAGTRTATFTPDSPLLPNTVYAATVSGAADLAGNVMAPVTWSFTTGTSGNACPCTIWPSSAVPAVAAAPDGDAVEVGVHFVSDAAGYISGLRFYKGAGNTGIHVGHLWTSTGTLLGTATFAGESPTGWQQVWFGTPIAVQANTSYIASYYAEAGHYALTEEYFQASDVYNAPLRAPASAAQLNGVFAQGSQFPTQSFRHSNYWVDVVFDPTYVDRGAPSVASQTPPTSGAGADPATSVTATFDESIDEGAVDIDLAVAGGASLASTASYDAPSKTITLDPQQPLAYATTYNATVSGMTDVAGNVAAPFSWSFTTKAQPAPLVSPASGPGGPILVVTNTRNKFSSYTNEILRAEGYNEFSTVDLAFLTTNSGLLGQYDIVILGQTSLSAAQVTMFTNWVNAGGDLIALRPDRKLAGLLGLATATPTLANAYLRVNTAVAPGSGITDQTIQFHGSADRYTLAGATAVASLWTGPLTASVNPAVTMRAVGSAGGHAGMFAYDLGRSIVYTRQGNPAWIGQDRDGSAPVRSNDLFQGSGSTPSWVNLGKMEIPQADEQMRLLANMLQYVSPAPLPHFWYFPKSAKAVVVSTGDDHGNNGTAGRFDLLSNASPSGCSVVQWTCLRSTSYMYASTPMSSSTAEAYRQQGFDMGVHVNTNCQNYTPATLAGIFAGQTSAFAQSFPSLGAPTSHRMHCVAYSDWSSQPKAERLFGMRLDMNYYHYGPTWAGLASSPGFMTGSGMPMRFAEIDGSYIDVYQAATQMTDESNQLYPATSNALLDKALGTEGYYGFFVANMHTDVADEPDHAALLTSVQQHANVAMISADQLLTWLDGRNSSSFGAMTWSGGNLSFSVTAAAGSTNLTGMLPVASSAGSLISLTRNGSAVTLTPQTIKGINYKTFPALSGSYAASYGASAGLLRASAITASALRATVAKPAAAKAPARKAPARKPVAVKISALKVTPMARNSALVTWTTSTPADTRLSYGRTTSVGERRDERRRTTAHRVTLTHLASGKTYFLKVGSVSATGASAGTGLVRFVTLAPSVGDSVAAEFRAGRPGGATAIRPDSDGVVLVVGGPGATGAFVSRVLDAQEAVTWDRITWTAGVPTGATLRLLVRSGGTRQPDGSWTEWQSVARSGTSLVSLSRHSRYLQYRVELTASPTGASPVLDAVNVTHSGTDLLGHDEAAHKPSGGIA
jgi:hypothetical protein